MKEQGFDENGSGWDPGNGVLQPCAAFLVLDPEFVELKLQPQAGVTKAEGDARSVRVKLDRQFLPLESLEKHSVGWRLRFKLTSSARASRGYHAVFVAATAPEQLAERESSWVLTELRWRNGQDKQLAPADGSSAPSERHP